MLSRLSQVLRARFSRVIVLVSLGIWIWGAQARAGEAERAPLNYSRDIEPILADTCYHCHGPDAAQRKADLRLDQQDSTLAEHDHHIAVVPGRPEKSELVTRILSSDPDEKMPPPKSNRSLTAEQVATLKRWVEDGAPWGKHWSYEPPQRPALPVVADAGWCRNPIDNFILARLQQEGLHPAPEAPREKLLRRVTFDLTGLPPTPHELDEFLSDTSPNAYDKVVDRLLSSPHYGERQAREWLDAARYADSNGFQEDRTRDVWPWRDWVVKSMNDNLPFNEFVVDQLAGDLLPNATQAQRMATCFNRNHMLNGEGGSIPEESRFNYVIDRVNTTSTVFLGLTIGCCQCHDHKYDPFTQKNYYQLFSYFNNLPESGSVDAGGNAKPVMKLKSPEDEKRIAELQEKVKNADAALSAALPQVDARQADWEKQAAAPVAWEAQRPTSFSSKNGATMKLLDDGSVLVGGPAPATDIHEVVIRTDGQAIGALRLEALTDSALPHEGPGRADENGNFVLTTLEAEAVSVAKPSERKKVSFTEAQATYSQEGWDVKGAIDADPKTGWAVWHAPDPHHLEATFRLAEPVAFPGGTELHLTLHYESPFPKHSLGHFRLSVAPAAPLPSKIIALLAIPAETRSAQQKNELLNYHREHVSSQYKGLKDAVAEESKQLAGIEAGLPEIMVMEDSQPRETHIHLRGVFDKEGEKVSPGAPEALEPLPAGAPANRLGLAQWVVSPENPLLARVTVNRYWQSFFGTGLVKTTEDFGTQGERPSHPQLLDWLATEFVGSRWNVKAMHRLIVTSATYRQSSNLTPELLERDPDNRLMARGPRHRLSAFELRDQALSVSGLLVDSLGGPPVFPYQPPNLWEEFSFGKIKYVQDHGEKLYRRSLYTYWRRTVQPTMMFDTASRQVCTVRQARTNTPLQSLILLNETGYVEDARVLAQKLLQEDKASESQRICEVFRRCTARLPRGPELEVLLDTLHHFQAQYRADKDNALKLIGNGEFPRDPKLDAGDLAAYTSLVNTILNLDESLTDE